MRSVYVAAAAGILLAGCSLIENHLSAADMDSDSAQPSLSATLHSGDVDDSVDSDMQELRRSAVSPIRIRGDGAVGSMANFCEAVAVSDADSSSYDPATSRRVEAARLAQCSALTKP